MPEHSLKKTLGPWSLTALGIGAVIGSGIFTVIGTAIAGEKFDTSSILSTPVLDYLVHHHALAGRPGAGPALAVSMLLVAVVCAFTGLCYAELASMIPIAGSAYTYTYATMGELIAWIIGWDLILEYAVSNMAVCVGFAAHIADFMDWFGIHPTARWISPAFLPSGLTDFQGRTIYTPGWHLGFNLPAFLIVMLITVVLVRGIRESAGTNNIIVLLKIGAILVFIAAGAHFIHPAHWHPFSPNGWSGVLTGGSIIFFTYIGFDSISTAAEECRRPQRDIPIGILGTLIVCTVLYVSVSMVLTGLIPWQTLVDDAAPVVNTLKKLSIETAIGEPELGSARRALRRDDGHDLLDSRLPTGAGADLVRDVARPAFSQLVRQGAPTFSDPCDSDLDRRHRSRDSERATGYRDIGRFVEYRNALCLCAGLDRRGDPAHSRA